MGGFGRLFLWWTMKYIAKKSFKHDKLGDVFKGQIVELASLSGVRSFVEPYQTKVEPDAPFTKAPASHSSASPAGQASQQTTAKPSGSGGNRGRPKKSGE